MKKLNCFFAALLVGGAALSLSSCIDTTEPAGIVAMRTSTSEYMKAKAGYENALAQLKLVEVEKEKVAVEAAKIALELDKIAVEQAKLALEKQAVLDSLELVLAEAGIQYEMAQLEEKAALDALTLALALAKSELDLAQIQYQIAQLEDQAALDDLAMTLAQAQNELSLAEVKAALAHLQDEAAMNALALALAQAQNEADLAAVALAIAQLNKQMGDLENEIAKNELEKEEYLLQREATLLNLYSNIALAEKAYLQSVTDLKLAMLTYKDEQMQTKLAEYEGQLLGYNTRLSNERTNLATAQIQKWSYSANKEMFVKELPVEKTKKEKEIELQKSLIAKYQELDQLGAGDITALYDQQKAYEDELEALTEKEKEAVAAIEEMKKIDPAVAGEIAALNLQIKKINEDIQAVNDSKVAKGEELDVEYPITIAKDDVDESMVATLAQALTGFPPAYFDAAFEVDNSTYPYTYTMVADYTFDVKLRDYVNNVNDLVTYGIKGAYQSEYKEIYAQVLGIPSYSAPSDLFAEDGTVKEQYAVMLEAALERLSKDESQVVKLKAQLDETYAAWGKAYADYLAATAKFKGYQNDAPEFDAAWEAVKAYKDAKKDTLNYKEDGNVAGKEAAVLYAIVNDFIVKKNAVDGLFTKKFTEDYDSLYIPEADEQDTLAVENFNALVASWYDVDYFEYYVGGKIPATSYWSSSDMDNAYKNGGALAKFLTLSNELFYGYSQVLGINNAIIPVKDGDKYVIPAGFVPEYGIWGDYVWASEGAAKTEVVLANLNKWVVLCANVEAQATQAQTMIDAIGEELTAMDGEITALGEEIVAIQEQITELEATQYDVEAVWVKEYECYLINGTWDASFTTNNPYYNAIVGGNYNVVTEKSVVEDAKKLVDDAIAEANGGFNYWFYNPKDEVMQQVSSGSLSSLIESAENDLANLEKDLEKLNAVIEAVSKFDAKAGNWEDFFNGNVQTAQYLDEQIAKIEANIAQLEGRVKVVEAAIASLIAAYEAGELDAEFPAEA